ncbi:MAG: alpha-amylase family glycosyl hydrolase, partial [Erysipelotrichaceae bacterium]|nr:alpha-amylase family glycosyl hydrolase [Erysipelotrichaceae bacterium]
MAYGLLNDYLLGQTIDAYKYFGVHKEIRDGVEGYVFRLYAPMAKDVSVIGEFNNWNPVVNKMNLIDISGTWEIFIPGVKDYQTYKFHFLNAKNNYVNKADPFAFFSDYKPGSCSRIFDYANFIWHDLKYMQKRTRNFDKPMSIYELHVGSWKGQVDNRNLSYEEVADYLIPYIKEHGFTHVELMPIVQYPFDGSWGYQATGFFSVDSRYGNPKQLMSFIDRMHQANIGVILDFAPVHFAVDDFGLIDFDGDYLFESKDPKRRYSQWGSVLFDLGKDPVRSFLMSAMNYFATEFHFDGIRMDAVSNIIFYDGNKDLGENHGAIEFLKRTNSYLHNRHSSLMMIAEDSSDYYGVTKPLDQYGLGFDYKWDLGWMNDTLKYYHLYPIYNKYDHNKLTFSKAYYFNENFILPFSHDELV